jgi:hypothetical protein
MLASATYVGKHEVKVNGGEEVIVREVPAIVTPVLREWARRSPRTGAPPLGATVSA